MFGILFISASCGGDEDNITQLAKDTEVIKEYLIDNNLTAEETSSGLHYIIEEPGIGDSNPTINSTVTVAYSGYFTNGQVFDSSDSISFPLSNVIPGWQEGIPLFKKQGSGKLLIPSILGYGSTGSGPIPGNTVLIFDIELKDF